MKILLLAFILWTPCTYANPIFMPGDGTDFRRYVAQARDYIRTKRVKSTDDAIQIGLAIGYIEAVAILLETEKSICPPQIALSSRNWVDIIYSYLEKTPKSDREFGAALVTGALREVFPCLK